MGDVEYQDALKLGRKEYRNRVSHGQFPYLPVLDEILSHADIQTEQNMGLMQIPLEFVVGTSTMGRTYSFAANFMPILEDGTEFSVKWSNLSEAQINEGIRDPIKCYEYMNRYYAVEGNKRVSVLKYFKADSIPAMVTRKIPRYSEDLNVKLYYEYMKFHEITEMCTLEFTKLGNAELLLKLVGKESHWEDEDRERFNKVLFHFSRAYKFRGGDRLPIKVGDALTAFLNVYGFEAALTMTDKEYNDKILRVWNEFGIMSENEEVDLVLNPTEVQEKKSLLGLLLPTMQKKFTVAFLYPRDPVTSDWIYAHELGRNYLEETFSNQLKTIYVQDVKEDNVEEVLNDVIEQGAKIIFGVAPQMMLPSLKVATQHPEVKILNCSLNTPHQYIRTYYSRMYEAKFLSGIVAGAMTENNRVGYIADYPIYGMIANINAFALGVATVNPAAKVYLAWSTSKGYDREQFLKDNDIQYVSDQDMITPTDASRRFGLYRVADGEVLNLVMPIWNWGAFYEKMIQSILAGAYQSEGGSENKALNYWWGMSAGVVDLICSKYVPKGVKQLVNHLSEDIRKGELEPFYGEVKDQEGNVMNKDYQSMDPMDIMKMDYLVENVIGSIPKKEEVIDEAKAVVEIKGVEEK